MLITLEQAKAQIEMDHDLSDDMLAEKVLEASAIVLDFLKKDADLWQDSSGVPQDVPLVVQAATKMVFGALFENREGGNEVNQDVPQPLSQAVKDLLHRYRDPAMA